MNLHRFKISVSPWPFHAHSKGKAHSRFQILGKSAADSKRQILVGAQQIPDFRFPSHHLDTHGEGEEDYTFQIQNKRPGAWRANQIQRLADSRIPRYPDSGVGKS